MIIRLLSSNIYVGSHELFFPKVCFITLTITLYSPLVLNSQRQIHFWRETICTTLKCVSSDRRMFNQLPDWVSETNFIWSVDRNSHRKASRERKQDHRGHLRWEKVNGTNLSSADFIYLATNRDSNRIKIRQREMSTSLYNYFDSCCYIIKSPVIKFLYATFLYYISAFIFRHWNIDFVSIQGVL